MNQGNNEMTIEMNAPTMPYARVIYQGQPINYLLGNNQKMELPFQRNSITPIDEDRRIQLEFKSVNDTIESISYEVRSIDGERLIESTNVYDYKQSKNEVKLDIVIKDLIQKETEYALIMQVQLEGKSPYYYYTKIIETTNSNAYDKIAFALEFHNVTFYKERGAELAIYLEPNASGDNTSYYYVNIHSSLSHIMWGDLTVREIGDPVITLKELGEQTGVITIETVVEIKGENKTVQCKVEEYYRVRYGTERIFLLQYERTAEEIVSMDDFKIVNNKLLLGIVDPNIETVESEGGTVIAFEIADSLYTYNLVDNKFSCLFNYYDGSKVEVRDYIANNEIKILSVEETGNVRFLVYGYKKRGSREGDIGVQMYYYDSQFNTIEEEIYIPYTKSAELLKQNINQMSYLTKNNILYLMLENAIYAIDLDNHQYDIVIDGLEDGNYHISETNEMLAWQTDRTGELSSQIIIKDLLSGEETIINAPHNEYIKSLGFIRNDLIYGFIKDEDIITNSTNQWIYPIYLVQIQNQQGEVVKKYQEENIYVTDCVVNNNHILVERIQKKIISEEEPIEFTYYKIVDDQIINNEVQTYKMNEVEVVITYEYKKIVQVILKSIVNANQLATLVPEIVLYEGERTIAIQKEQDVSAQYYVYTRNGIENSYYNASDAVLLAKELSGVVVNQYGKLVWESGNLATRNQIMAITSYIPNDNNSQLAECIDIILEYEGVTQSTQNLVAQGYTAMEILERTLPDSTVLDLTGCTINDMLFYLNRDMPVLVLLNEGDAVLLTGFNTTEVVVLDPITGILTKKSISEVRTWFQENGNYFITYIENGVDG